MSEESKDLRAWIVAAVLVGFVFFEEARFGRWHGERPSFPVRQAEVEADSHQKSDAEVILVPTSEMIVGAVASELPRDEPEPDPE